MDVETPTLIDLSPFTSFRAANRGMAKKFPGFPFSGYRNVAFYGSILVSMEQYRYMMDEYYAHVFKGVADEYLKNGPRYKEINEYMSNI